MQRLYMGYTGHTRSIYYSGIIEKLWCDHYYGYVTRIYRPCFNNLARIFYTTASRMHIILYLLFIKYFKFYILKILGIYAAYI